MFFDILYKRKKDFLKKKGLNEKVSVGEAIGDLLKENGTLPTPDFKNYVSGVYGKLSGKLCIRADSRTVNILGSQ